MNPKDNTSLFNGRVQNYIKYRPTYPSTLIDFLTQHCGVSSESTVADIGSGTGFLTEMLLKNGNTVFAVEPNAEMRSAAEQLLGGYPKFRSVAAGAEATTIRSKSMDAVTAAQSFHWFDHSAAKLEFIRILKPRGWVALIWNKARVDSTFEKEYDEFWRIDLRGAHEARDGYEALIKPFFEEGHYQRAVLMGVSQVMNRVEFIGRILSISAAIQPNETGYEAFLKKVEDIFHRNQANGNVTLNYDIEIYFGQLVK